jgi:hypothetical protein
MLTDYSAYNTSMRKALEDKLFFLDKIEVDTLLDYGCADGHLIKSIANKFKWVMGYDIDKKMILAASKDKPANSYFSTEFDEISPVNRLKNGILLSSVIHEVYSYGADIEQFWQRVWNHDYVVIRDMLPSKSIKRKTILEDFVTCRSKLHSQVIEFEQVYGSLVGQQNLLHFLLKYRYVKNWERELKENYFSLYLEDLLELIPKEFEIVYLNHYCLPWLQNRVRKDFGILIQDNTHLQLILKRRVLNEKD